jgi:hypothetical protein
VFGHVTRLQKQLEAVQGGQDITAIQHRSMRTPVIAAPSHAAGSQSAARSTSLPTASTAPPTASTGQPATGRPGTASTARTPLSVKSNALDEESAAYWHKR